MKQGENWHSDTMEFPAPGYIQLYPTTKCNQQCPFCFNPESGPSADLTFNNALALLDILTDNGINDIDIMGGEPFLIPWITDFLERGLAKGMSLNISTNGSIPGLLDLFRGISHERFNIGISLEGSSPAKHNKLTGSDNFATTLLSIKKLVGFSLNPIVKTVYNKETADDIQNIVDLVRGIGVRRYYIIHMDILSKNETWMKHSVPYGAFLDFQRKIKKVNPDIGIHRVNASCFDKNTLPPGVRCAGGVRKLSVMPDGSVYPCNLFHNMKDFELGNIFRDKFSDIWANARLNSFRMHQANRCGIYTCKNRRSCTGGCPAHGYYHYGNPDTPDIRCVQALA